MDDFCDVLFNPAKGLGRVAKDRSIWQGLAVYLLVSIIISLATLNVDSFAASPLLLREPSPFLTTDFLQRTQHLFPLLTFFVQLLFAPLYFFLLVAIQNFAAGLFAGEGKITSLGAVLGYAHLPLLIIAIGGLLGRYTSFNILGLVGLIAFLWSVVLKIAGIRLVYDFSWGRASLIFFMPLIALVTSFILFILLAIVFLFPMFMQALEGFPGYSPF